MRHIVGYDLEYTIDTDGNIYKIYKDTPKLLWQNISAQGYPRVTLKLDGRKICKNVHRFVAEAFIPNPNNYPVVNHKDGNKQNNSINNLEWCTQKHNVRHAFAIGLNKSSGKLDPLIVEQIYLLAIVGVPSIRITADYFLNKTHVYYIKNNLIWKHLNLKDKYYGYTKEQALIQARKLGARGLEHL